MKKINLVLIASAFSVFIVGCSTTEKSELPVRDEVFHYDLSYDLTFLRVIEALENVQGWELEETEKEKGYIKVRNTDFGRFGDDDKSLVIFEIKRVERDDTSIGLAKVSQQTLGAGELLDKVQQFLNRETQHKAMLKAAIKKAAEPQPSASAASVS